MENNVKKREWVKTAAIIFLAVLLVLTFFSNTIMNYSLPEVAVQTVTSGPINAKIRGSGSVSANETYDVTITQTRRIASVLVKVGQEVAAGDALFILEAEESDELKAAQEQLASLELAYQKSLIEAGNADTTENRQIEKAREDYNKALNLYYQYSSMDASQVEAAKAQAEKKLKDLQRAQEQAQEDLDARAEEKADLEAELTKLEADVTALRTIMDKDAAYQAADQTNTQDRLKYKAARDFLYEKIANNSHETAMTYARYPEKIAVILDNPGGSLDIDFQIFLNENPDFMYNTYTYDGESDGSGSVTYDAYATAGTENYQYALKFAASYLAWEDSEKAYLSVKQELARLLEDRYNVLIVYDVASASYNNLEAYRSQASRDYQDIFGQYNQVLVTVQDFDMYTESFKAALDAAKLAVEDQQDYISDLSNAVSAAANVEATKEALEDLLFQQSLADGSYLDLEAAKEAIEDQKKEVERLTANADEAEVTAKVSGVIGAINVTAGNTIGAESPLCTIQVVDRGYTIKIPVTNEQAKKVKVGDQAELVNYWGGDIEAVLESIASDPANPGKGRLLVFRLSGEVEPDINLTLSIGQKSSNFDCLVPKSAVRSDSNGSFVLVMVAKSSPLGNRYTAVRADVQVLASDDTMSAVSGVSAGDFVITTSTQPIEAGQQVRQVEAG